jgi:hypothetical protein
MFFTAVLDETYIDRPNQTGGLVPDIVDELARDVLATQTVATGRSQDGSITTELDAVDPSPDLNGATTAVPAILRLAAGLKGLVLGLWSSRIRPNESQSRKDADDDPAD